MLALSLTKLRILPAAPYRWDAIEGSQVSLDLPLGLSGDF